MRRFVFAAVSIIQLASLAVAQDSIEIKFYQPKVGDRVQVTLEERIDTESTRFVRGRDLKKPATKVTVFVYVDEFLAVAAGDRPAVKLQRSYAKATVSEGDKTRPLAVEGQSVLIEWKDGKYGFAVHGMPLEGEAAGLLDAEFNRPDRLSPRPLITGAKLVKPGETRPLNAALAFAGLAADKSIRGLNGAAVKFDKTKLVATGMLAQTHKIGTAQFGKFEFQVNAPVLRDPKLLRTSVDGNRSVSLSADLCIDGTSPEARTKVVQRTAFKWSSVDTGIEVDSTLTKIHTAKRATP